MAAATRKTKIRDKAGSKKSDSDGRSRPKGASRAPEKSSVFMLAGFIKGSVKYFVAASAVGLVFGLIFWLNPKSKLEEFTHKPINEVLIEGRFHLFEKAAAQAIIKEHVTGSFIDLDIQKLKQSLESSPWVDSVLITREWPDRLIVKISEQQAIAKWGKENFLNMRGDIISVKNVKKMDGLPFLNGNDSYAKDVMKQYLRMGKLFQQNNIKLESIELDDTLSWKLIVDQNITIKLGRDRIWEKLQNLMLAKQGVLGDTFSQIEKVDMRYPSGFAIEWKQEEKNHYVAGAK